MNTKFVRACLWLVSLSSFLILIILGIMMFANNIQPNVHVPFWIVLCVVLQNFILFVVIARFLYFQDEYFNIMNSFYPIISRVSQVQDIKKQG